MNVPGRRSILLVEDEEPIREIGADELMFRGFDVGAETANYATYKPDRKPAQEFDLLITDCPANETASEVRA